MDIPDMLYLNRFGWEFNKDFQYRWADIYNSALDDDGVQHLKLEYDEFTNHNVLTFKKFSGYGYVPVEPLKLWNYKPLTMYTFTEGKDDATYVYRRFNQYIKEHQSELGISIEKDRKLASEAINFGKFKTFDKWTPKVDKPLNRDYWYQYWGGFAEGYLSTDKDLK